MYRGLLMALLGPAACLGFLSTSLPFFASSPNRLSAESRASVREEVRSRMLVAIGMPAAEMIAPDASSFGYLLPQEAAAQTQDSNSTGYSAQGTVINSATGEPIRGALVEAAGQAMLTGTDGKFSFQNLPELSTLVQVHKPGFFNEADLSGYYLSQQIESDPTTPPAVIKLTPEGVIFGRVTGPDGEGIEGLPVQLMFGAIEQGRKQWSSPFRKVTDENGEFRIAELRPGEYYLSVGPAPNETFTNGGTSASAGVYPVSFYPGSPTVDSATAIQVSPGSHIEANFSMSPQPSFRLSGTITGYTPTQTVSVIFENESGQGASAGVRFDFNTGKFEISDVTAGSYRIRALSEARGSKGAQLGAEVAVNVNSNSANLHLALAPLVSIPVRFRFDSGTNASTPYPEGITGVLLHSVDEIPARVIGMSVNDSDDNVAFSGVRPGIYSAEITTNKCYVESATYGSIDLLRENLTIAPGTPALPIEIVCAGNGASLKGVVSSDGHASPGIVLLISDRAPGNPQVSVTNERGEFKASDLAPGIYHILAFDSIYGLEYTNSDALRNYTSNATDITLTPSEESSVNVELIHRAEQ